MQSNDGTDLSKTTEIHRLEIIELPGHVNKYLGSSDILSAAISARKEASDWYGFHETHGRNE